MSIFDTLAENRYQQWLEARRQPGYRPPEPRATTRERLSFEGMLYQRVLALLTQAGDLPAGADREDLLQTAARVELQLMVALEKKGLPRVAQTLRESIRVHAGKAGIRSLPSVLNRRA